MPLVEGQTRRSAIKLLVVLAPVCVVSLLGLLNPFSFAIGLPLTIVTGPPTLGVVRLAREKALDLPRWQRMWTLIVMSLISAVWAWATFFALDDIDTVADVTVQLVIVAMLVVGWQGCVRVVFGSADDLEVEQFNERLRHARGARRI